MSVLLILDLSMVFIRPSIVLGSLLLGGTTCLYVGDQHPTFALTRELLGNSYGQEPPPTIGLRGAIDHSESLSMNAVCAHV